MGGHVGVRVRLCGMCTQPPGHDASCAVLIHACACACMRISSTRARCAAPCEQLVRFPRVDVAEPVVHGVQVAHAELHGRGIVGLALLEGHARERGCGAGGARVPAADACRALAAAPCAAPPALQPPTPPPHPSGLHLHGQQVRDEAVEEGVLRVLHLLSKRARHLSPMLATTCCCCASRQQQMQMGAPIAHNKVCGAPQLSLAHTCVAFIARAPKERSRVRTARSRGARQRQRGGASLRLRAAARGSAAVQA